MHRSNANLWIAVLAAVIGLTGAGCGDVGDSSAIPGGGVDGSANADASSGMGDDATQPNAQSEAAAAVMNEADGNPGDAEAAAQDAGAQDSTLEDSGTTGAQDSGPQDVGGPEAAAKTPDAGAADVGTTGMGTPDTGVPDMGTPDTEPQDTGYPEVGALEAGPPDAGIPDASDGGTDAEDTGVEDTSTPDAVAETGTTDGSDASALHPCVVAGDTNCVQCQGNDKAPKADKTCTLTEAMLVQHDIDKGYATAAGPDPMESCYTCLYNGGCVDDTHFSDMNHECEDTLTSGTLSQCYDTITCIFGSSCAVSQVGVCYCGTAGILSTCQGNPATGPINGACADTIAAGLGFPVSDGTDNTAKLEDIGRAAGKADQIFQCALTNDCAKCQQ